MSKASVLRKRFLRSGAVLCVGLLVAWGPAAGEDRGRRIYDEQLRVELDRQMPEAREFGFDAGGWFNFALFKFDDAGARRWRTLRQYELRGWASLNLQGVHQFYVRGLTAYDDWNDGDNPTSSRSDDLTEPKIERAWYQLDLGALHRNRTGQAPPVGFKLKVGRQFADIGTAFVLSMPMDMVQIEVTPGDWDIRAFLGKTIRSTHNIDDSEPVAGHQERCLWGVEVAYTGFTHHRPFVYYLNNRDHTTPKPWSAFERFSYDSSYVGIGSTGSLIVPNLRYQAELAGEWGETYSGTFPPERDDICAIGFDLLLEYLFQAPCRPRVSFEYMYSSGDDDSSSSATATTGGNTGGTKDRAFNAFGFRDTGIAFSPTVSNLHIFVLGASVMPLRQHKLFKHMEVGTKAFFYHKDEKNGPISDTTATVNSSWVGWEWDAYCNWRLTSDLTWTIRYGAFMPGAAFEDRTCRQFLYTGITLSF